MSLLDSDPVGFLNLEAIMTNSDRERYQSIEVLREILKRTLKGLKFQLDCGHYVTFGHFLGNNVTIYNGKDLRIICSECGY
jgi:hypothetical protein